MFSVAGDATSRLLEIDFRGRGLHELGTFPGRAPMLSPTGTHVLSMAGTWTATKLTVSRVDGAEPRGITDGSSIAWNCHWSPDGKRLAVQVNSRSTKGSAHLWIVDVESGQAQKLAAHTEVYLDETPSWFPDGNRLAFQSNRTGRMEVWTMGVDGTGARQVTRP